MPLVAQAATEVPRPSLPLLRSVSLPSGHQIQPLGRRRCTSNEPVLLLQALKANNHNSSLSNSKTIQEEYLQDFWKWANQQTVRMLPCVSPDHPLMPTRITLRNNISLAEVTKTVADCLQRLQEQGVFFTHHPHPEHVGRIDISCMTCQLKFVLQLWRTDDGAIVVELQRRRGCSVFMHHLRRPLFAALQKLQMQSAATTTNDADENDEPVPKTTTAPNKMSFRRSSLRFPAPLRSSFQ